MHSGPDGEPMTLPRDTAREQHSPESNRAWEAGPAAMKSRVWGSRSWRCRSIDGALTHRCRASAGPHDGETAERVCLARDRMRHAFKLPRPANNTSRREPLTRVCTRHAHHHTGRHALPHHAAHSWMVTTAPMTAYMHNTTHPDPSPPCAHASPVWTHCADGLASLAPRHTHGCANRAPLAQRR